MSQSFINLIVINTCVVVWLLSRSRSSLFGTFAGSAINPLIVFSLCVLLFNLDFLAVQANPVVDYLGDHIGQVYFLSQRSVEYAYTVFTVLMCSCAGGFALALKLPLTASRATSDGLTKRLDELPARTAAALYWIVIGISAPVLFHSFLAARTAAPGTYNYQVSGHENVLPSMIESMLPYVTALYLAHRSPARKSSVLSVFLAMLLIAMAAGARGPVLLMGFMLATRFVADGRRISPAWYITALPCAALVLSFLGYTFRETGKYVSYSGFVAAKGGYLGLFFEGEEGGVAKALAVVVQYAHTLSLTPGVSFLGLAMFPLPRAMFWFKPMGASSHFTEIMAPERWDLTKSESLVTGFGDLYLQFGIVCGALVVFVCAFCWLRCCLYCIRAGQKSSVFWMPILIWSACMFMRGDIFNLGFIVWPVLVVLIVHRLLIAIGMLYPPLVLSRCRNAFF